jgi:hypothetical protein
LIIKGFLAGLEDLREFMLHYQIVTNFYVIAPLIFVGFMCNLLIVVVLGRDKTMNKTTRFLLQALASADMAFYVLRPLNDILLLLITKYDITLYMGLDLNVACFVVGMLLSASQTITAWMTVIVTYQRYVAVSRPLHVRQYVTMSRARVAVAVVWIGSVVIYIPFITSEKRNLCFMTTNFGSNFAYYLSLLRLFYRYY